MARYCSHFPDDNFVFQDDNAPIHRARVEKEHMVETVLHGMEWPAQSPDLNIIENVWHRIKHELQNMFKTSPHVSCWKLLFATEIPIYYIQDLYKSIPKHLK